MHVCGVQLERQLWLDASLIPYLASISKILAFDLKASDGADIVAI